MKCTFSYLLLFTTLFVIIGILPAQAHPQEATIRVGILSNQQHIVISSDTDFEIRNSQTGQLVEHLGAKEQAIISLNGKNMIVNGKQVAAGKISVLKLKHNDTNYIEVNKNPYRGDIDLYLTKGKNGMTVVNTLPVEQYLYGVIGREISPSWHLEAVKAQAVAARTYGMYNLNKHQNDGYDVCATTDCQVYGGLNSEAPQVIKAVNDTSGQIIMYKGKIISAYFHSNSGGYTENSENVWSTYVPYLRGVVDYDQNSPQYKWEKKLTPSELETAMDKAGYHIGTLTAIELAPLQNKPMMATERGVSGRVKIIRIIGTNDSAQLTGEKFRKILDLKSTLFDINVMSAEQKRMGIGTNKPGIYPISGTPKEMIIISGFGWGHGLGLSQWGAKAMAEKGPQGDPTYFKEILKHYYQGVEIIKVF